MEQAKQDGGPAFPAPDLGEQDFNQRAAYPGMTLRDYFAAKAPAEPQQWFKPAMPHPHPSAPAIPDFTEAEREEYRAYNGDALEIEQIESPRLAGYLRSRIFHNKQSRDWNEDYEKQRFVQWPYAWADAMLAARGAA